MVGKINLYANNKKIGECEIYKNEFNELVSFNGKNVNVYDDWKQTDEQGFVQSLDIVINSIPINQEILNEILAIEWEFGFQAGRWGENEYIFEDIAEAEYTYITSKCEELEFKYNIDKEMLQDIAQKWQETMVTDTDIKESRITNENYWQFDALANDIKEQLIDFLKEQL